MRKTLTILLLSVSAALYSQNQKIDPTVEVNRDYQGKMMEITKGKLATETADSLNSFHLDFNYSFFNKPYKDMYEFSAVPSARIPKMETTYTPVLIAKLGIGLPFVTEGGILFSPHLEKGHNFNLNGDFNLFKGDVPEISISNGKTEKTGRKVDDKEYTYGIGAGYTYAWKSGEFNVSAGFKGGLGTYYGNRVPENQDTPVQDHSYTRFEAGIGVKSSGAGKYGQKLNYALEAGFAHTQDKSAGKLQENHFAVSGEVGPTVGRYNKFMAGFGVETAGFGGTADYSTGLFDITPQYRYENGKLKVNLGVKLQGHFGEKERSEKYHSFIFPAVDLSFNLLPDNLWLYGKVDGSNTLNTYWQTLMQNNHINPDTTPEGLMTGSVPLNVEGGFKGRATDRIWYRIYAGYTIHKGLQQFCYDQENGWFNTFYSNTNEFGIGAEFAFSTERIQGGIKARHSSFSKGKKSTFKDGMEAIGFPALKGGAWLQYNWEKKIYAGVECKFRSESEFICKDGTTGTAEGFADLGANVKYVHNSVFSFWLKGSNLLNSPLQYQPFYGGKGIGISAGIIVKL